MSFESSNPRVPSHRPLASRSTAGKAIRARKSRLTKERPVSSACKKVIEALEQRQLLTGNGWEVSYWGNNSNAGTDGVQPTYVVQDIGTNSAGTVVDLAGHTVSDAINYSGGATTVPPQLSSVGVTSAWTAGPGGCSFSARFDGILTAPETATYTFYPGTDDGDELIVDGQILDNFLNGSRGVTYESCPISVQWTAGSTHQISFLFQNGGGGWGQDLRWSDNTASSIGSSSGSYSNGACTYPYIPISAITIPAGPLNASVQAVTGGDTVNWSGFNPTAGGTATTDSGASLTYDVYRAPATVGGTLATVSAFTKVASAVASNSYTDATVVAGQAYDYRVTPAGVALTTSGNILNTGTGLASSLNGTSANSTGTNDTLIGAGDGLTAQYFNSLDDSSATVGVHDESAGSNADNLTQDHAGVYSRIDTQIATDSGKVSSPPGVPTTFVAPNGTNSFSIRWDGYVLAPETGSYIFYPASDDNERLAVGKPTNLTGGANAFDFGGSTVSTPGNGTNETIVAEGTGSGSASGTTTSGGVTLDFLNNGGRGTTYDPSERSVNAGGTYGTVIYATAGQLIPIQLDYNEGGGGWHYSLNWEGPGFGSAKVSPNYTSTYTLLTAPDLYAAKPETPTVAALGGYQSAFLTLSLPLSGFASGGTAADSFNIYRSTTAGVQGPLVGTLAIPNAQANSAITTYNFTDPGLSSSPATKYYYTVTAVAGGVQSTASTQISITTTQNPPAAPNPAVARNADGTTTITWPAVPFATGYTVYRSSDGVTFTPLTAGTNLSGSTTVFTDVTATGNSFYYYQVSASNGAGSSANSGSVYVANGDGFAATYFPSPFAGATSAASGFHNNTTSETSSYWQDVANPLTPNPAASNDGFGGTNSYQTIDSSINFSGSGATVKPSSTPTGYDSVNGGGVSMSAEWDFTVIPQYTGQYTFFPSTDDGTQLNVDGNLLDDQSLPGNRGNAPSVPYQNVTADTVPVTDGTTPPAVPANLPNGTVNTDNEPIGIYSGNPIIWQAGSVHTVRMIWGQSVGGWAAQLYWSSGGNNAANPTANFGQPFAIVPQYEAYATVAAVPHGAIAGTPTTAVASVNSSTVQLVWDSVQADSYLVYRTAAGAAAPTAGTVPTYGSLLTTVAGTTAVPAYTYSDTTVVNGSTYYYTIVPQTANPTAGAGGTVGPLLSGTPTIVPATPQLVPPAAPVISSTKIGNLVSPETLGEAAPPPSNVTITWGAVPFATAYNVLRAPVTNGVAGTYALLAPSAGTTATTFTDATAAIGTIYDYEVQALNAANQSNPGPGSTSGPGKVDLLDGVVENFWAGSQDWGSTIDTGTAAPTVPPASPPITTPGVYAVGNPTTSSFEPNVNYTDTSGGVNAPPGGTQGTTYSTEFTGKIHITSAGTYTFYTSTDDFGFLFVDGSLVADGNYVNANTAADNYGDGGPNNNPTYTTDPIALAANTTYNFQFYQQQGGGGDQFIMYYKGPDTASANKVVPTTALTDQMGAPSPVTLSGSIGAETGSLYPVTITFPDVNTNEQAYLLQRSTSPTFASGTVTTIQTAGVQDNGDGTAGTAGNHPTVTLTDTAAPQASTQYYRVVAVNFEAAAASSNVLTEVIPAAATTSGAVEAHFYKNEWWASTPQNTGGLVNNASSSTGVGTTLSATSLLADENTTLSGALAINGSGTDTGTGTLEANGNGSRYPDPAGIIGPDNFSSVFTGEVAITAAGTYNFMANTDDDGYLYVDNILASAYPGGHGANNGEAIYPLNLTAGQHDIQFFQSNGGGGWAFQMFYSGPDTSNSSVIVPSSALSTLSHPAVAPTTFTASVGSTPTQVTLAWSNNNTSAIRYIIQRSTDSTFNTNVTTVDVGLNGTPANAATFPAVSSYTDTGLIFNTTYYYRIFAQNYDGTAPAANAAVTIPNNYPAVNSVTAVQDVNGNIQVSFPAELYSGINGYQLLRSVNNGAYAPVTGSPFYSASAAQYTYQDNAAALTPGNTYTYEVITQGTTSGNSAPAASNPLYYVTTPASGGTMINHAAGFAGQTDLTLTGNGTFTPVVTANGPLQLTSAATGEATGAYETTPLSLNADFSTSFDFQFAEATTPAADGFTFDIQGLGASALGASGGGLGYTGVTPSLAVFFNMYNNVTQTGLGTNGNLQNAVDMSGTLGNAFNSTGAGNATDVFQVSLTYQASTQTLFEAIRDTTTGKGYSTSYNLSSYGLSASTLLGPGSVDYVGFSAGTGASVSQQVINDWVLNDVSSVRTAQQPQSVSASEQVNGNIAVSFPAPSTGGLSGITYQILKSVNGGAYANVGSPIAATSTNSYTYQDTGPFTIGSTYTYQAIISGTSPSNPATSNTVAYVDSSTLVNSVTSYHNDPQSTGQNLTESILTPANVSSKTGFGKLFSTAVDGQVYAEPLVKPGVNITSGNYPGTHTVAYVETENDSLYAIDSITGQVLWKDSFLTPEASLTSGGATVAVSVVTSGDVNTGDISPQIGITSTPVIDNSTGYMYLVAKTKQIVNGNTTSPHFVLTLYKIDIGSGSTVSSTVIGDTTYNTSSGAYTYNAGPYVLDPNGQGAGVVSATVNGATQNVIYFNALREANRAGLALHNGTVYIGFASHGDNGPYHGWVLGFNASSLASTAVFNSNPNGNDDGIWQGGDTLTFDAQGYMYFETGNGTFDTTLNAQGLPQYGDYGDAVVKLAIDSASTQNSQNTNGWGLKVADYFSPSNTVALANADEDLGSGGTLILPDSVGSAAHPHLMLAAGKEGKIYLIDRDNMGHFSPTTDNVVQEIAGGIGGGGSYGTPAFFNDGTTNWIYWGGKNDNGRAYKISNGVITTPSTYTTPNSFGLNGATPGVSADGTNNGIVWNIDGGSSQLFGYNASNLSQELFASGTNSTRDGLGTAVKFTTPSIANGEVFVGTANSLVVYGLFVQATSAPPTPTSLAAAPVSNTQINLSWSETAVSIDAPAGFNIDESANNGNTWTQIGTAGAGATSFPVTGLQPGTTYDFKIDAFNSVGTSTFSNVASATTTNLAASVNLPSGFANAASQLQLNGTAAINGANLELTSGANNQVASAFTKGTMSVNGFNTSFQFQLTNAVADGFTFTLQNNANTSIGTGGGGLGYEGIANSVCIKFDLYNNAGEGTDSTGLFIDGDTPEVPSGDVAGEASVDMTSGGVVLSSGDPMLANLSYNGTTLTEQVTDLSTNAVFTQSYTVNIPSILGSPTGYVGFTAGTGGANAIQNIQSWTYTPTAGIPYAPTNFTVTPASGTELDLSWIDSLSTVTNYNVLELQNGTYTQIAQVAGTATGVPVTGLNSGATYSFEVVAVNSAGSSPPAGPITGTTPVAPVDVTSFAFSNLTTGSVTLTWANDPSNATGLVLTRQLESDSSQYVTTLAPTVTTYTDSTLLPGRIYQYTLAARNLAGPSNGVELTIETVPTAPTGLTATAGPGEVTLNWTANGHAVSSYNVYRGATPGGEGKTPIATNVPPASFIDTSATGLVAGQQYYYTVTAVDTGGESVASAEVSATPTVMTAPTLVGSPVINGDNPNGLFNAAGQGATAGDQRSMVQDVVYTFSAPVTIPSASAAFTVVGTGPNAGTAPATLTVTAVPGSNGTQWAVTLTGGAAGALGSIANGEYSITINASAVFAVADGTTQLAAGRTDQFYRLFGDINGDETVNASDSLQFKKALTTYNPAFDSNADGSVNAADSLQLKKDLSVGYAGDGFVPTI